MLLSYRMRAPDSHRVESLGLEAAFESFPTRRRTGIQAVADILPRPGPQSLEHKRKYSSGSLETVLTVVIGSVPCRSEVAALTFGHIQQRDGRWCIVDLVGRHYRVRTIPKPTWVKVSIDDWVATAVIADGFVFRPVNRGDRVTGAGVSERRGRGCCRNRAP